MARVPATAKAIPDGYHSVTPYLIVRGAAKAIGFYEKAFDAKVLFRMDAPGGRIGHGEMQIGDSRVMFADEHPEIDIHAPEKFGGSPMSLMLYVPDVDATFAKAIAAGAKVKRALADQFYGDRLGTLIDPFGHTWNVATHKEDVSPEEMKKRAGLPG